MKSEMKAVLASGLELSLTYNDLYGRVSAMLHTRKRKKFQVFAHADAPVGVQSYGHSYDSRARIAHHKGEQDFQLWLGSTCFIVPVSCLQAVRDFAAFDYIEYDRETQSVTGRAVGARIVEAG